MLYKKVKLVGGVEVQYLAVYALKWRKDVHGLPGCGFVGVDEAELPKVQALKAMHKAEMGMRREAEERFKELAETNVATLGALAEAITVLEAVQREYLSLGGVELPVPGAAQAARVMVEMVVGLRARVEELEVRIDKLEREVPVRTFDIGDYQEDGL